MSLRPLAVALALAPLPALAEIPPIGQVPEITEGLIDTALAYEIGRVCGPIDGRRLQGLGFLMSLQARARSLGFPQSEVDAYIHDGVEKDRLEAIARQRLVVMGAVPGDEASHCAVGRAEMAKGTQVGRLLSE